MSNERIDLTQFEARTKGPWAVIRREDCPEVGWENEKAFDIVSQNDIAETKRPHWEGLTVASVDYGWVTDDDEWVTRLEYSETGATLREMIDADARAIAAVPDLIAELKRCYEALDELDIIVDLLIENHFVETGPYETVKHLIETHQDYKASK